ncbi:MAG: hypothetical protein SPK06_06690, partial [Kiritimatiellia bacterium]|nr:hypothetical protein [Kiritimatiellia bacterium]
MIAQRVRFCQTNWQEAGRLVCTFGGDGLAPSGGIGCYPSGEEVGTFGQRGLRRSRMALARAGVMPGSAT